MSNNPKKVVIADTNVFIRNPAEVNDLQEDGNALLVIPWKVQTELDFNKTKPDIGMDARTAINLIEENQLSGKNLSFWRKKKWKGLEFDSPVDGDQIILATINSAISEMEACIHAETIEIISADTNFRILAREIFAENKRVRVVEYTKDEEDVLSYAPPQHLEIPKNMVLENGVYRFIQNSDKPIIENEGVIIRGEKLGFETDFPAYRKDDRLIEIDPNIEAFGITPRSLNGSAHNFGQAHALQQLLDPDIKLSFLIGGAGTGKTLLALAAAMEKKSDYRKILVSRPLVPMGETDTMGYLPGDIKGKMNPWLLPIWQNLEVIKDLGEDYKKKIENALDEKKIDIQSLDYIRGASFFKTLLIIDEAQNLTAHQIKTIITRVGEDTKIIFTGDLSQIDATRKISARSSGLNYAATRMQNNPLVSVNIFKESVRSELTQLALDRLG